MKILIGVDDSPHSKAALEFVKSLPWHPGTRFAVVSAAEPQAVAHTFVDAGVVSWVQEAEQETARHAQELTAHVERDLRTAGLTTEARVVRGDPRDVLVDEAHKLGPDLMVVGSHGRTGLERLLMGSVASHVVSHAPCSVLVVRRRKP